MKQKLLLVLFCLSYPLFGYEINVRVVDDRNIAVSRAEVTIAFIGFVQGSGKTHEGFANEEGIFRAEGSAEHSVFVAAKAEGHYNARIRRLPNDQEIELKVVLPRILNPIPLYAKNVESMIPKQNEWLGYDFEKGDWVQPHGTGEIVDILFRFKNEFKGWKDNVKNLADEIEFSKRTYAARGEEWTEEKFKINTGKWDVWLEIAFSGEKEGIFEETDFLTYSQFKLPHMAQEVDYLSTWNYENNNYSPRTARENIGFFLRTRVKLDDSGNIVSARYTKIMGDFYIVPYGVLRFTYYYNPMSLDRNLEWNTKQNLFEGLKSRDTPNSP